MTNKINKKKARKPFANNDFETLAKKKKVENSVGDSDMCSVEKIKNKKVKGDPITAIKANETAKEMGGKVNKKSKKDKKNKNTAESPSAKEISDQLSRSQRKRMKAKLKKKSHENNTSPVKVKTDDGNESEKNGKILKRLKMVEKLKNGAMSLTEVKNKLSSGKLTKSQKHRLRRIKNLILQSENGKETDNSKIKENSKKGENKKIENSKKKLAKKSSIGSDYEVEEEIKIEKPSMSNESDNENDEEDNENENDSEDDENDNEDDESDNEADENDNEESDKEDTNVNGIEQKNTPTKGQSRYVVFVGNLPFSAGMEEIKEHFVKTCEVISIRIQKDKESNKPRGFAYVELKNEDSYQKALLLHHTFLGGRRINVLYTKPGTKNSPKQKNELKKKNLKLKAMREKGTFGDSQKNINKRNDRRKKQLNVNNNE